MSEANDFSPKFFNPAKKPDHGEKDIGYYFEDMAACPGKEFVAKAKNPWELLKLKNEFLKIDKTENFGEVHKSVVIKGKAWIGKGTVIDPYCVIEGPVIIGKNCEVRSCAWIRPNTIIGDNCVIGHGDEIKNALIFDEAKIGTNCFVGDSILGKGARLGSGTILGNRRFDQGEVFLKFNGEKISTGTDKFGAIVGDYSRLGANVAANPGTLIGKHTWVFGGVSVSGLIPANKIVKLKQELIFEDKRPVALKIEDASGKK